MLATSRGRGETGEGIYRLGESNHFSRTDVSKDGDEMHEKQVISRRDFEMYSREQGSDRQGNTFWEEFSTPTEHAIDSFASLAIASPPLFSECHVKRVLRRKQIHVGIGRHRQHGKKVCLFIIIAVDAPAPGSGVFKV